MYAEFPLHIFSVKGSFMNRRIAFSNSHLCVGAIWLVGMMIGFAFAYFQNTSIAPNNFGGIFMSPSLLSIFLSSVLPIGAALLVWRLRIYYIVYIILFINGLVFGFCSLYLSNLLGYSLFVTHLLFMFSQSCCSTLLVALC